jgi:alkylation response protein AidB-like acyl-CoA dehydrogenase
MWSSEQRADAREWDALVAREVARQAGIEAAFDRIDACVRLGDVRGALEWLDEADRLGGGLPPAYRAQRRRLKRQVACAEELAEAPVFG